MDRETRQLVRSIKAQGLTPEKIAYLLNELLDKGISSSASITLLYELFHKLESSVYKEDYTGDMVDFWPIALEYLTNLVTAHYVALHKDKILIYRREKYHTGTVSFDYISSPCGRRDFGCKSTFLPIRENRFLAVSLEEALSKDLCKKCRKFLEKQHG